MIFARLSWLIYCRVDMPLLGLLDQQCAVPRWRRRSMPTHPETRASRALWQRLTVDRLWRAMTWLRNLTHLSNFRTCQEIY